MQESWNSTQITATIIVYIIYSVHVYNGVQSLNSLVHILLISLSYKFPSPPTIKKEKKYFEMGPWWPHKLRMFSLLPTSDETRIFSNVEP